MTVHSPFIPHYGVTQTVTPGAASAAVTIGGKNKSLRIINSGTGLAFFRYSHVSEPIPASAADCPIAAGTTLIIGKDTDMANFAYISAAGTTLILTPGEGGYS